MDKSVPVEEVIKALSANPRFDYSYFFRSGKLNLMDLLIFRVLNGGGRKFVIRRIKAPIEKALIKSVKLYIKVFGAITRENTRKRNTHTLLDLEAEFFTHYINPSRMELMRAAWALLEFEAEHDVHYEYILHWFLRRINEKRAEGAWVDMPEAFPQENCWREEVND